MDRTDRLFLERQVRGIDDAMRTFADMRSTLLRRIRRMEAAQPGVRRAVVRAASPPPSPAVSDLRARLQVRQAANLQVRQAVNQTEANRVVIVVDDLIDEPLPIRRTQATTFQGTATANQRPRAPVNRISDTIRTKSKMIRKSELESMTEDTCGICLSHHVRVDSVECNCRHTFGQECLNHWKRTCLARNTLTTCPTCRETIKTLTTFRQRASATKKSTTATTIMNPIANNADTVGTIIE